MIFDYVLHINYCELWWMLIIMGYGGLQLKRSLTDPVYKFGIKPAQHFETNVSRFA